MSRRLEPQLNPQLITLARQLRGISQKDLAKQVGVTNAFISLIENGSRPPGDKLDLIASALEVPVSFFYREDVVYPPSYLYYRKRSSLSAKHKEKYEALQNLTRIGIESLLRQVEVPDFTLRPMMSNVFSNPIEAARITRELLGMPKGPISNLTGLLEDHGVIIIYLPLDFDKADGVSLVTQLNHPIIIVNSLMPPCRIRFTIAHELAHLVLHHQRIVSEEIDVEKEANEFASEFLVPHDQFKPVYTSDLPYWGSQKLYWRVSMKALMYSAKKWERITYDQHLNLSKKMSAMGYSKKEPSNFDLPQEHPTLFHEVIKAHIDELDYTIDEVIKLSDLSFRDFRYLFDWPKSETTGPIMKVVR